MWSIIVILAVSSISCTYCQDESDGSNDNGYTAEPMQAYGIALGGKSHVSLRFQDVQYGIATIIAPQFVVTSCSVILKKPIYEATIVAGLSSFNLHGHVHHARDTECHPEFKLLQSAMAAGVNRKVHDIGLIRVDSDFTTSQSTIPPIAMVEGYYPPPIGALARVYSFSAEGELAGIDVEVLSKDVCKHEFRNEGGLNYGEICAVGNRNGQLPINICNEDEGSPLILDDTILAFASWVPGCNFNETVPSVFTEIARSRYWIDSAMEQMFERERREQMSWLEKITAAESPDTRKCKIDVDTQEQISMRNCNPLCRDRFATRGDCDSMVCRCHEKTGERSYKDVKRTIEGEI